MKRINGKEVVAYVGRNMFFTSPLEGEDVRRPDEGVLKRESLFCTPSPRCWRTRPLPQGARVTARGFTLIELLVVVLIIGILAAVAVPQYQKAVYKSRAVEAVTLIKALVDAQEIYYLANGEYTDDISKLDVNIPAELIKSSSSADPLFEDKYSYTCARKKECAAFAKNNNLPDFQFNFRHVDDVDAGKFYCNLGDGNSKTDMAKSICQSMGRLDETRTQAWAVGKYFIIN